MKSQHVSITKTKSYLSCFEAFVVEFFVNFLYVILQRRHWKQRYHVKDTKSEQNLVTWKESLAPEYEEIHFRSRRDPLNGSILKPRSHNQITSGVLPRLHAIKVDKPETAQEKALIFLRLRFPDIITKTSFNNCLKWNLVISENPNLPNS